MTRLIGLSGSLRKGSFNTALLRATAAVAPADCEVVVETLHGVPLYDEDLEAEGIPARVEALKTAIAEADGLLLVTPEYNNSIPGVLKNAVDWLSRPPADVPRVFGGKPVAIIGASPGGFGTILSQSAWLPVLRTLRATHWAGERVMVSRAHTVFDAGLSLADEKVASQLRAFIEGFAAFARAQRRG